MEYKYDSRKNRASRMKREEIFFSVSHFATPLPPSTFYLPPVTWIHTLSAKINYLLRIRTVPHCFDELISAFVLSDNYNARRT